MWCDFHEFNERCRVFYFLIMLLGIWAGERTWADIWISWRNWSATTLWSKSDKFWRCKNAFKLNDLTSQNYSNLSGDTRKHRKISELLVVT